jgi:hypothetical protein
MAVDDESGPGAGLASPAGRASDWAGIELRHAIPGRVRLRIPGIKGQAEMAREVERQLAGLAVVRRVAVSPVTGSVLVIYDPADSAAIADLARIMIPGLDLDGLSSPGAGDPAVAAATATSAPAVAVADFARRLNTRVEAATGVADLRFLVPASLFVGGLIRLIASKQLTSPAWYDFFWFAFGTFATMNRGLAPAPPDADAPTPASGAQPASRPAARRALGVPSGHELARS